MNIDRRKLREQSEAFAETHLRECAEELLEWSDTALLRDGRVRELANLIAEWAGQRDALPIAEGIVKRAALRAVVTPNGQGQRSDDGLIVGDSAAPQGSASPSCGD